MQGTLLDFLKLAYEKPRLAQELAELAARHGFEFSDAMTDEALEGVAGGVTSAAGGAELKALLAPFGGDLEQLRALVKSLEGGMGGGSKATGQTVYSEGKGLPTVGGDGGV